MTWQLLNFYLDQLNKYTYIMQWFIFEIMCKSLKQNFKQFNNRNDSFKLCNFFDNLKYIS